MTDSLRELEQKIAALTCAGCANGEPIEQIAGYPAHRHMNVICTSKAPEIMALITPLLAKNELDEAIGADLNATSSAGCSEPPTSELEKLRDKWQRRKALCIRRWNDSQGAYATGWRCRADTLDTCIDELERLAFFR